MMGGIMDGIAQALTYSLHLEDGHFLEGSWDNAFYTRQWNVAAEVEVIVMPPTGERARRCRRVRRRRRRWPRSRCAYGARDRHDADEFPINHDAPLGFEPVPTVPPIPRRHRRPQTDSAL